MPRPGEVAIAFSVALAAIAAGYALFGDVGSTGASSSSTSSMTAQREWSAVPSMSVGEPLRVANPFDSSEIFEFPAGTSEADAHEAVAGFLLERATRRGVASDRRHAGPKS
jgi:hypothetical protein